MQALKATNLTRPQTKISHNRVTEFHTTRSSHLERSSLSNRRSYATGSSKDVEEQDMREQNIKKYGFICSATNSTFQEMVVQSPVPVLLDFWADWCEPCKKLTPILEKVVNGAQGGVRLVKINADDCKEIVEELRVKSLPTLMALVNGRLTSRTEGLLKEETVQELVDTMLKQGGMSKTSQLLKEGEDLLQEGNVAGAVEIFDYLAASSVLKAQGFALAGLALCALQNKQTDDARTLIDLVKKDFSADLNHPLVKKAIAAVELMAAGDTPPDEAEEKLVKILEQNPDDQQSRYDLAISYFQKNQHEKAINECLTMIKKERKWNEEAARKLAIKIIDALGPSPLATKSRKRLTNLLF
eukprot:TRINITY_DN3235_c0_g1_i1.p1 TRINITY_DN3235_c0_g1~~TRINITY_DN3235_c0_g1_i1.p1  ORF type:complete len:356 (-),score=103.95 TRINITY_DN3235_c0_g1_i1:24-1091(-)